MVPPRPPRIRKKRQHTDAWYRAYQEYLASPEWARIRDRVLQQYGYRCQGCWDQEANQVHHLTYEHLGNELMFELLPLCGACHTRYSLCGEFGQLRNKRTRTRRKRRGKDGESMFGKETRDAAQTGGGRYVRLGTEPVELVLIGDEISGKAKFDDVSKRYIKDEHGSFRFAINAWRPAPAEMSILEGPKRLANELIRLHDSGVDLSRTVVRVVRSGQGLSTQFHAEPVRALEDAEAVALKEMEVHELARVISWAMEPVVGANSGDEIPF